MKRLALLLSLISALMLAGAGTVAAQSAETDVAAVGEAALAVDPEALVDALTAAPDDSVLPDGFMNPESGTPANQEIIAAFASPLGDLDGSVGTITHGLDTDSGVVPGVVSAGIITYIVVEDEITSDDLADFEEGAREGLGSAITDATPAWSSAEEDSSESATPDAESDSVDASVNVIDVAGVDAVQIEVVSAQGDFVSVVEIVAIPVGNTMVVGTVVTADQGEPDTAVVLDLASQLGVAGVDNLGIVVESAG